MAKPVGYAQGRGRGQDRGGVAKAVGALPRRWERGQGLGGVAKDLEAWPRP